jgi:pyridoxine 5-phosphate synthase
MKSKKWLVPRLGVNIDHLATLRQLRGTPYPNLLEAVRMVEKAGAHQITIHLREDRRHIQDADVFAIRKHIQVDLNLEMAVNDSIVKIANRVKPDWVCLVPEKRQEVTTEGGLDVKKLSKKLSKLIPAFQKKGIRVSLFIEPDVKTVEWSKKLGADAIEIHTGQYCHAAQGAYGKKSKAVQSKELNRIQLACLAGIDAGIRVNAGHGFDLQNVRPVVELGLIEEYNIGHSIICRAALVGLDQAVREMLSAVQAP